MYTLTWIQTQGIDDNEEKKKEKEEAQTDYEKTLTFLSATLGDKKISKVCRCVCRACEEEQRGAGPAPQQGRHGVSQQACCMCFFARIVRTQTKQSPGGQEYPTEAVTSKSGKCQAV